MKTIKFILFAMFMLFASNVMANSFYYSTSGSVRIVCEIYKNGSMVDAATDYLSF